MKILFISSGNSKNGISPIIRNQGVSIERLGENISYFTIEGKGLKGYFNNIFRIRRLLKKEKFDLIHAHYSLSAFVASLAGAKPLVASLMGSDVKAHSFFKLWIRLFAFFCWKVTIVKSKDMAIILKLSKLLVIPNGVDFSHFKPLDKIVCQKQLGWDYGKKHIFFASDPKRTEKNFRLADEAIKLINNFNLEVHFLKNVPHKNVPLYHNAADVVLLSSLWEGSPNVIKEAMACNRPIVATNVGDITELLNGTKGCFVTSFNKEEMAKNILLALEYNVTNGRENIEHLRSDKIAQRIIEIYKNIKK